MHRKYKLRFFDFIEVNGKMYFSNLFFNGLVELDIKTGRINNIYQFPNYAKKNRWLYSKVERIGKNLIFTPDRSEQIALFDIDTHKFKIIAFDKSVVGENKPYFRCMYLYKDYVYMFPSKAKCILRYDLKENEVEYLGNDIFEMYNDENYFRQQYEVVDKKLYLPFTHRNSILIFDLETERIEIVTLESGTGWSTINYVNEHMWMSSWKSNEIFKWNLKTREINIYDDFPHGIEIGECKFAFSCVLGNKILYFPIFENMIIVFDVLSGKIGCDIKKKVITEEPIMTYNVVNEKNQILASFAETEQIYRYNISQGSLKEINYVIYDCEFNNKKIDEYMSLGECKTERSKKDFYQFIKSISESEDKVDIGPGKCQCSKGECIYSILREGIKDNI